MISIEDAIECGCGARMCNNCPVVDDCPIAIPVHHNNEDDSASVIDSSVIVADDGVHLI